MQYHKKLAQLYQEKPNNRLRRDGPDFEKNFFTTRAPRKLKRARVYKVLNSKIEGHIIVCGVVKGIINLILPLRSRALGDQKRTIVILANDNLGEENIKYDTYIWNEINRFEDIYLITGSALNPEDLEKARVAKAYSIIILAKNHEGANKNDAKVLDAEAIFMYKTIAKQHK
jgi:hypothetical protein